MGWVQLAIFNAPERLHQWNNLVHVDKHFKFHGHMTYWKKCFLKSNFRPYLYWNCRNDYWKYMIHCWSFQKKKSVIDVRISEDFLVIFASSKASTWLQLKCFRPKHFTFWTECLANQKIPHLLWNQKVLSAGAYHTSLSWSRWIQFSPSRPIFIRSILIIYCIILLVFLVSSCLQASQPKFFYAFLISPMRATYSAHLNLVVLLVNSHQN
jgi:hypothetical protein